MSHELLLIAFMSGSLLGLYLMHLWETRGTREMKRDAAYWRRLEATMDQKESALVILGEMEQMRADHDRLMDSYVKRGAQSVEDLMRLH